MPQPPLRFSPPANARIAGSLYGLIIVLGLASEIFVRQALVVPDDPTTTASRLLASSGLFRAGFLADSLMCFSDVAVAVLLYTLLRPVHRTLALLATAFRLTQTAILALNLLNQHTALLVLSGPAYGAFDPAQRNALAYLMLDRHAHGYDLGLLFFGLHCLLLGYLIVRSTFLPKALGWVVAAAALPYLAGSYVHFLAPDLLPAIAPIYLIAIVAEVALGGWLLVKGVNVPRWRAAQAATTAA